MSPPPYNVYIPPDGTFFNDYLIKHISPTKSSRFKNIEITMPDYNNNQVNIAIDFGLSFEPDRFGSVSVSFDQFESAINQ